MAGRGGVRTEERGGAARATLSGMSASSFLRRRAAGAASLAAALAAGPAGATVFHVAQAGGADTNDGTLAHPLLTIAACAAVAQPGDTCEVHAGTYRETVSPPRSGTATAPI